MNFKESIKTDDSTLTTINIKDIQQHDKKILKKSLIRKCVEEVKDNLNHYPEIIIAGRVCHQRRDVGFFSDDSIGYHYSGKLAESKPLTKYLKRLLKKVNKLYNTSFNGILINRYNDGNDYISAHSDDERNLDPQGVISISYGSTRIFRIRNKYTKKIIKDIELNNLDIVHMKGDFQKEFTHEIPKDTTIKTERYSFTFRKHQK